MYKKQKISYLQKRGGSKMSELIMSVKSRLSMFGLYNLYDLVEK
jgi:hypothetical protein